MDSVVMDMLERGTSMAIQAVLAIMDMTAPTADPSGRRRSTTAPRLTAANTVAVAEVEAGVVAKVEEAKVEAKVEAIAPFDTRLSAALTPRATSAQSAKQRKGTKAL
jgi:hypothetical protein